MKFKIADLSAPGMEHLFELFFMQQSGIKKASSDSLLRRQKKQIYFLPVFSFAIKTYTGK